MIKNNRNGTSCAFCHNRAQFSIYGGLCGLHFFEFLPDMMKQWRKERRLRFTKTKNIKGANVK